MVYQKKAKTHIFSKKAFKKSKTKRRTLDEHWAGLTNTEQEEILKLYYKNKKKILKNLEV